MEARRRDPSPPTWPPPNAPRTDIDGFAALAFCRWLGYAAPLPVRGGIVSLPDDAQWVAAYVGESGADFPWNGDPDPERHANFDNVLGRSSAVGIFPDGAAQNVAVIPTVIIIVGVLRLLAPEEFAEPRLQDVWSPPGTSRVTPCLGTRAAVAQPRLLR